MPLPRCLLRPPHIHSKTACRGFKSFCPCQKSQVSLVRYLTFSLVCGRIWQRGAPAGSPAVRVLGRWSPVATVQRRPRRQPRPSPSAPATKPAKTLGFRRFSFRMCCMVMWCTLVRTLGFLPLVLFVPNRPHPLQHPKRTRLRLFSHELGCVSLFLLVFGQKIFDIFFVHSADMVHKSKSLVIPLSRDVSFLT